MSQRNLKEIIKATAELIKQGKGIVCSTSTVYGLIADAKNEKAVGKILR